MGVLEEKERELLSKRIERETTDIGETTQNNWEYPGLFV